jgi:hypothetical protein
MKCKKLEIQVNVQQDFTVHNNSVLKKEMITGFSMYFENFEKKFMA